MYTHTHMLTSTHTIQIHIHTSHQHAHIQMHVHSHVQSHILFALLVVSCKHILLNKGKYLLHPPVHMLSSCLSHTQLVSSSDTFAVCTRVYLSSPSSSSSMVTCLSLPSLPAVPIAISLSIFSQLIILTVWVLYLSLIILQDIFTMSANRINTELLLALKIDIVSSLSFIHNCLSSHLQPVFLLLPPYLHLLATGFVWLLSEF